MSSTSAPFGLQPAYSPSGVIRPTAYSIATGYATTIYQNQPVKIGADGVLEAAAVNDRFIGTFAGVEYTDSNGRRTFSNKWTASTAGTDIVAYATLDPSIVYNIQTNAAVTKADIGEQFDFTAASGNSTTGLGSQMLDVASTAANAALRIIGLTPGPDNAWGDTYVIVQVQISEHQNVADVAAY
jgi:hypothetical protein